MPCQADKYDRSVGLLLNVGVASPGTHAPPARQMPQATPFPTLVDTGASVTCISPHVAQTVGLRPMGLRPMVSATQVVPVHTYLVDLLIPFGRTAFVRQAVQVMEFAPPAGSPYQVLLGRDVVCDGVLTLSFDGHFTFAL